MRHSSSMYRQNADGMLLLHTVHIKHTDGHFEKIPYFSLPANDLTEVIAPSCYSCFDYPNALADLVVGYMGVPYEGGNFSSHPQVSFQTRLLPERFLANSVQSKSWS